MEATQGSLFRLEHWHEYWYLPLNPSKRGASFFSVYLHQANLQPNLLLFNFRLRFNPTSNFPEVNFDRTLSFSKDLSSLQAKFFSMSQGLTLYLCFFMGPSKESISLLYEAFLRPLLTYTSPG